MTLLVGNWILLCWRSPSLQLPFRWCGGISRQSEALGLLVLTLLWLVRVRPGLSLHVLNGFFWSSVAAGGLWFILDLSEYGLLPGQYAQGADRGIEWRVSLFPYVPESGFFALIVFLANQLHRRGRARIFVLPGLALFHHLQRDAIRFGCARSRRGLHTIQSKSAKSLHPHRGTVVAARRFRCFNRNRQSSVNDAGVAWRHDHELFCSEQSRSMIRIWH